ncbi:hypothetical protein PNOK_0481400 [Pyrrhoderma noxium]|uniref:Uncharacterized protein n=1 Tax=Pyrrhoderma noxium TaxID=2282107 RepID=A0A286UJX5_9AGAM|nr:hypothetical protein PNOK_0481400 [Pyrrhoderma noxium]
MNSLSLMNIIKKILNLLLFKAKKSLQWFLALFPRLARLCKLSMHQGQERRVCDNDGTDKGHNISHIRHTLATSGVPSIPSEEQQTIPFSVTGPSSAHNPHLSSTRAPLPHSHPQPQLDSRTPSFTPSLPCVEENWGYETIKVTQGRMTSEPESTGTDLLLNKLTSSQTQRKKRVIMLHI